MTQQEESLEHVNKSGFPLQIALARLVRGMQSGWRILYEEHAWRRAENSGFVDLILENDALSTVLLIECKRLQNASYIFLPSDRGDRAAGRVKAYYANRGEHGSLLPNYPAWVDVHLASSAPEVAYCVVRKEGGSREQTIETICAQLIVASEAVEHEERDFYLNREKVQQRLYFSAIVTTAHLEVCSFDPGKVSLADGLLPDGAAVEPADMVRFRKQLSFDTPTNPLSLASSSRESAKLAGGKERTVFVIGAEHLETFLRKFQFVNAPRYS